MTEYIIQEQINLIDTRRVLTDDEVCQRLAHHVQFGAIGRTAKADGKTPFTIRFQIVSLPLSDESRRPIHEARNIPIVGDDGETFFVETNEQGYGEFEVAFAAAGQYHFTTDSAIYSDGITIEAV